MLGQGDVQFQLRQLADVRGRLKSQLQSVCPQLLRLQGKASPRGVLHSVGTDHHRAVPQYLPGREGGRNRQQFGLIHARHGNQFGLLQQCGEAGGRALLFGGGVHAEQRGLGIDEGDDHGRRVEETGVVNRGARLLVT